MKGIIKYKIKDKQRYFNISTTCLYESKNIQTQNHNAKKLMQENCGRIITLLAKIPKSSECLDAGFIVYSMESKKRLLHVKQKTIDKFTLTSEEFALEICIGVLKHSSANLVIATTGITGSRPMDGIKPGRSVGKP